MKVLPIVGRELREGSRRRGTYWARTGVAALALIAGIGSYALTLVNPTAKMGTSLFWGLAGVSMLFCLLAGRRSTADCISQEKRDGTLGLLFLTDLKGYDVVLGKLAATSITGLYALLAVFPVLTVPLLTGGMSRGEVGRMVVVLVNTFFFSSAIGIFASAISREYRTAMAANFLLWLALVGLPAGLGCGIGIAKSRWILPFFYSCPIYSFIETADPIFIAGGLGDFWRSIAVTAALAWMLTLAACVIVPLTWGDKPPRKASRRGWWRRDVNSLVNYGDAEGRIAFRRKALNTNAYFWHVARARLKPIHVWLFIVMGGVWWICCWFREGRIWLDEATYVSTAVIVNSAFKLWITLEAGQRLGEDRRSGAFELLLATPLTVSDILRGQWIALRRQFLKPLLIVIVVELVFIATLHQTRKAGALIVAATLFALPFDLFALVWVSMSAALTAKSQMKATMEAVSRILILPWGLFWLLHAGVSAYNWLAFRSWDPSTSEEAFIWVGISLAVDAGFGFWARRCVRHEFRHMATQSWKSVNWRALVKQIGAWLGALLIRAPARVVIPVGLAIAVALGAVLLTRRRPAEFAPPVIATMTQSNAPLRIFGTGRRGVFLILPDGSLWRWGETDLQHRGIAAPPEQVGTNHNWVNVWADGLDCLGLRSDGTIWFVALSSGPNSGGLQLAIDGTNWGGVGGMHYGQPFALKKDGTIWAWDWGRLPFPARRNRLERRPIGSASAAGATRISDCDLMELCGFGVRLQCSGTVRIGPEPTLTSRRCCARTPIGLVLTMKLMRETGPENYGTQRSACQNRIQAPPTFARG